MGDASTIKTPEFEEKQFEHALTQEIVAGSPTAYASGQVLESVVGYDVALHPGSDKIFRLLNAGFPPGVVLSSGFWTSAREAPEDADLPRDLVSLVLQMKRPQHLDHWRAGQDHYWQGPYFRFYIEEKQQAQLGGLEEGLGHQALVRYVAPAFLGLSDLYANQRHRTIAESSNFVSPAVLHNHFLWSYAAPGTHGYANPEGGEASSDTWTTLLEKASAAQRRQSLSAHVSTLAEALNGRTDASGLARIIARDETALDDDRVRTLAAWVDVAGAVAESGAEWFVLDLTER